MSRISLQGLRGRTHVLASLSLGLVTLSLLFLGGCTKTKAERIKGWWLAIQVTQQDGSVVNIHTRDESFMLGFNDTFQFYLLDGSLPDCSGVDHAYKIDGDAIHAYSAKGCGDKSATIDSVQSGTGEGRKLVLRNVHLGGSLIYKEIVLGSINYSTVKRLYDNTFVPNTRHYRESLADAETEKGSSGGVSSRPAPSSTNRPIRRSPPTPPEPTEEVRVQNAATDQEFTDQLPGFWLLESLDYEGQTHFPGDSWKNNAGTTINFYKHTVVLEFENGKMKVYRDKFSTGLPQNLGFRVINSRLNLVMDFQGQQIKQEMMELRNIDLSHGQLRTGNMKGNEVVNLGPKDAVVFRKISVQEAGTQLKGNPDFAKAHPDAK